MQRVLIIGGGAAGMSAASWIRRLSPDMKVTVLESTQMVSHAPCGVPYFLEGLFDDPNLFMTYEPSFFIEKRGIDLRINTRVKELNIKDRHVTVEIKDKVESIDYDYLILATGSVPITVKNDGTERVYFVHHPAHASELRKALWSLNKIAVIGGGILGIETAEALSVKGKKVVLIHRGKYPLNRMVDEDISSFFLPKMISEIDLRLGEAVLEVRDKGRLVITDKGEYKVDGTVIAIGVRPNSDLVKGQLKLGVYDSIVTNEKMETSEKGVFAAGDVAQSFNLITKQSDWVPYAPVANKMGFVAAFNVSGIEKKFPGVVGTMITKYRETLVGKVGLTSAEATRYNFKIKEALVKHKTRARYYPGSKDIWVKLIANEKDSRILGVEIVGQEEVLGRLDVLAEAIMKGATVEDLFFMENAYLPAVARVWDPLVLAARKIYAGD
ncbi:FAD-dependent oxidoreductase [Sulfuracidifex metallicus]|uniref:CoA-disulfide reductase n=1 Tax=Sulfuracidifex metallicus DSM 6482 = JCM 9184 TaxID=523847 RepID=A0A6A9QJ37_SULME|nr:FAD-dependent oxidoreductase [Sulfuracidifex metallicus]MUN29297.1 CoA-disulfide reductase [Sulfuracidifex metallicus DSM 6482 = JCM 9184]WOE50189.1 FAD-dependent oxidoreductase [Sulfuracidifex metallicus DSM 6482 = JCM 9184]